MASTSTSSASTASNKPPTADIPKPTVEEERELFDDSDIEKLLASEASNLTREKEAERILSAFKLDPYAILDVAPGVTEDELNKIYRKKSLLIHPDRFKHPRGPEAFDLLKKAQTELLDAEKRKILDRTILDARMLVLRSLGLGPDTPDTHDKVRFLQPSMRERTKGKLKELMVEDEIRKRRTNRMAMIAEGAEAQRVEKAQTERKRKADEKAAWEDSREHRVTDWRSFQKGGNKKKKPKVLG